MSFVGDLDPSRDAVGSSGCGVGTPEFVMDRGRGLVWVCDIQGSTESLNSDGSIDQVETFFSRLYWLALGIVGAARGEFIKWTGDGFLAWFPLSLERQLPTRAAMVMRAIWHASFLVNVTQLETRAEPPLVLRHGLTYEPDALLLHAAGARSGPLDIIGRDVVLAFRLSGVRASFPGVAMSKNVADALKSQGEFTVPMTAWRPTREERLRYFKGETRGSRILYRTTDKKPKRLSKRAVLRRLRQTLDSTPAAVRERSASVDFLAALTQYMIDGPSWSRAVAAEEARFLEEEVAQPIQDLLPYLEH